MFSNTTEARIHSLEVSVRRIEELIRRKQLSGFENKNIYFKIHNTSLSSRKLYDNDVTFINVEESNAGNIPVTRRLPGIHESVPLSKHISTYILKFKQNVVYNILWLLVHTLAVLISGYYIKTAFDSWQSSPVVQATSNSQVHHENISFPAVTICWPFRFNREYNFYERIENCFDCKDKVCAMKNKTCGYTDLMELMFAFQLCPKFAVEYTLSDAQKIRNENLISGRIDAAEYSKYAWTLMPSCESESVVARMVTESSPIMALTRCHSNVFQQFFSPQQRVCMTFNSLRHKDIFEDKVVTSIPMTERASNGVPVWSVDSMMDFKGGLNTTPIYGLSGYALGIRPYENLFENACAYVHNDLVTIMIHSPSEIPLLTTSDISVLKDTGVSIYITPKITLARDLAQYSPLQRGCYFVHERKLAMFKMYTKYNCDIECYINTSMSACGCVPFVYPRPNSSVKVCVLSCSVPDSYNCMCLPECNSFKYDVTTQILPISLVKLGNISVVGLVEIKFSETKFYTNIRYSITSNKEFLAYTLGVLGAFLGFSVTCVWRLVYFGIARLWSYVRNPLGKVFSSLTR